MYKVLNDCKNVNQLYIFHFLSFFSKYAFLCCIYELVDFFLPNKNKIQKENDFETTRTHCCKQING